MKAKVYNFSPMVIQTNTEPKKISKHWIGSVMIALIAISLFIVHLTKLQESSYSNQENAPVAQTDNAVSAQQGTPYFQSIDSYLKNYSNASSPMNSRIENYRIENIKGISQSENELRFTAVFSVKPMSNRSIWAERIGPISTSGWTPARTNMIRAVRSGDSYSIVEIRNLN